MSRPLSLLIAAAAVAAAPLPALAQIWSSTTAAATPQLQGQTRASMALERAATLNRPSLPGARDERVALKIAPTDSEADEALDVELRPKAEWSDDQGLRVGATRLGYKSRF